MDIFAAKQKFCCMLLSQLKPEQDDLPSISCRGQEGFGEEDSLGQKGTEGVVL